MQDPESDGHTHTDKHFDYCNLLRMHAEKILFKPDESEEVSAHQFS